MTDHPCPNCGSTATLVVPGPHPGGHHARLECADCSRFLRWLPRPSNREGSVPAEILAMVHPRNRPAPLDGTEAQCRFARSLRERALFCFHRMNRPDLVALLRCVVDASWFIANKGKPLSAIRWPSEWQMESVMPYGKCPNCGEPTYGAQVCSDECSDEFVAYLRKEVANQEAHSTGRPSTRSRSPSQSREGRADPRT